MPCEYSPVKECDCHDCHKRGYECANCIAYGQWTPDNWLMVPCLNCIQSLNRTNCYPANIVGVPNRILSEPEKESWKQYWEQSEATARRYGASFGNDEPLNRPREVNTPTFTADMFSTPTRTIRNNRVVEPISFESSDNDDVFSEESDTEDNECQSFISLQCEHCGRLGAAHTHRIAEIQGWTYLEEEDVWYCHYEDCQEAYTNSWDIYTCHRCGLCCRFSDDQHMLESEWNTSLLDGDLLCDDCVPLVEEEQRRFYNSDDGYNPDASTVIAGTEQTSLPETTESNNELNV